MTRRQKQAYDYIGSFIADHGFAPSYEEIMAEMGLKSKAGIHRLIYGLKALGLIELLPGHHRTIRIKAPVEDQLRERLGAIAEMSANRYPSFDVLRDIHELAREA